MEIETKPFSIAHLDVFKVSEKYRTQCYEQGKWMDALGKIDRCGIQLIDGRILYVSAYFSVSPGVVEVFITPSVYVKQYALAFYRHVRWWLDHIGREPGVRRLQTWGDDTEESKRWLTSLGFKHEGTLESYAGEGRPTLIWGMVCKQSQAQ